MPLLSAPVRSFVAGIAVTLCIAPGSAIAGTSLGQADKSAAVGHVERPFARAARSSAVRLARREQSARATALLGPHPDEELVWNGRPHRNLCIHMTGGEAIVPLLAGDAPSDDPNGFEVYANEKYDTTSRPILDGRAIEIRTPSFPTYTGSICLGVAPKAATGENPSGQSTR